MIQLQIKDASLLLPLYAKHGLLSLTSSNGVKKEDKAHIRIGISAICWSIWTSRNDIIFNRHKGTNFLQVILRAAQWIQLWVYMLPEDQRGIMDTGCSRLLKVTQDCYFQTTGWCHNSRIRDG
jgi:hypothetical protein